MYSYLEIALINAVMILPMALVAEATGRAFRRPALTHLLWVLILVKLVTPPIWQIPVVDRDWLASAGRQLVPPLLVEFDHLDLRPPFGQIADHSPILTKPKLRLRTLAEQNKRPGVRQITPLTVASKWIRSDAFRQLSLSAIQMVWALVALVWFCTQGFRCLRFRWSLKRGTAAPQELQQYSQYLAMQLGLSHSPIVWLMPGVMSPMLWGNGQSTLLIFPRRLLERLDRQATGTLLTHELAHYKRGDHWVRMIALMATGFFWWHPVVWWARREIEAVEEECCDALVIKAAGAAPKCYAEAILDAVDFLAELPLRLPPLATGLGEVPFLRQRLTWIMRGPRRQNLGYCGRILCLLLACTLPCQPTWISAARSSPSSPTSSPKLPISRPPTLDQSAPMPTGISGTSSDRTGFESAKVLRSQPTRFNVLSRWSGFEVRSHSSDGRFVVLGNKSTNYILDLESAQDFDLGDFLITGMAFAIHSHHFATIGEDRFLRLWNAETFEVVNAWPIPGGVLKSVDISSDGRMIVTGDRDGFIRIWNIESPHLVHELPQETASVNCVRFSHELDVLAIATGDSMSPHGRIALFDVGSWTERISMNWNSPTAAIAFRDDGMSLTSADWHGRIAKWSIDSGELLGLSNGHQTLISAAEFSPNGSSLAEIDVPDLPVNVSWDEPKPREPFPWFFNNWPSPSKF